MLGFTASSALRAAFGLLLVAVFAALVWGIEGHSMVGANSASTPLVPAAATQRLSVRIESTYPVSAWTVARLGVPLIPQASETLVWRGEISVASGDELLVIAQAAPGAGAGNRCLRLTIGTQVPQLIWGEGDITTTVAIP